MLRFVQFPLRLAINGLVPPAVESWIVCASWVGSSVMDESINKRQVVCVS